jgi:NTE family protein
MKSSKLSTGRAKSGGWRPDRCDQIAPIFQGGGALGAYQAGVYEALHEANIEPDWVTGVSIGAVNAAIIAGNPREARLEKLRAFWHKTPLMHHAWLQMPDSGILVHDVHRLRDSER